MPHPVRRDFSVQFRVTNQPLEPGSYPSMDRTPAMMQNGADTLTGLEPTPCGCVISLVLQRGDPIIMRFPPPHVAEQRRWQAHHGPPLGGVLAFSLASPPDHPRLQVNPGPGGAFMPQDLGRNARPGSCVDPHQHRAPEVTAIGCG